MENRMHASAADHAYQVLRRKIILKELQPGQRLSETKLAEQIELSRTPIREALPRLRTDGLVIMVPNSGAWVASPSLQEMEHVFDVREGLECMAAERAARFATLSQICLLEEKIEEEAEVFRARNFEQYLGVNTAFHRTLAEAGGNPVLVEYVEKLLARTFVFMVFYEDFFERRQNPSLEGHRRLVDALRDKDPETCVAVMHAHIRTSVEDLRRTYSHMT